MNNYFKLYSNCIPVLGNNESIIVDIQNNEYINIPNLLYDVLNKSNFKTVKEIKSFYNNELDEGINHYFRYLNKIDYGFYLDDVQCFPDLDLTWNSPLKINNAILVIGENCAYDFDIAIRELSNLGCSSIQIRIYDSNVNHILLKIINETRMSRIRNIELYLPETLFEDKYCKYLEDIENRISTLIIHSVKDEISKNENYKNLKFFKQKKLFFISKVVDNSTSDRISKQNFIVNMDFFCESQNHNVALNRKVCIDNEGNFKNFLSHESNFGNFKNKNISKLISDSNFTKKWFINNDNIEICKDCQFRYLCFDNSDVTFDGIGWKKINRCPFNPYTNEWEECSTNLLKENSSL